MGIFTSALRNKKIRQILKKNTSPRFHSVLLVIWPLTLMKRAHLSELFISRFSTHIRKALFINNQTKFARRQKDLLGSLESRWTSRVQFHLNNLNQLNSIFCRLGNVGQLSVSIINSTETSYSEFVQSNLHLEANWFRRSEWQEKQDLPTEVFSN